MGRERSPRHIKSIRHAPRKQKQTRIVTRTALRPRVAAAERLLAYRQRAFKERPRPRKVALVLKQPSEVVEARRRIEMLGAERLLVYRQRAFKARPRPRKVTLVVKQ